MANLNHQLQNNHLNQMSSDNGRSSNLILGLPFLHLARFYVFILSGPDVSGVSKGNVDP